MTEFGGWEMPLQYTRIMDEHMAVRNNAGIFDVSHMGDVTIRGKDSSRFVDFLLPTKVSDLEAGKCIYTAFLDDNGNIIDDTIIYRVSEEEYFFVPNAGPTEGILKWIEGHRNGFEIEIINHSYEMSSIALQGPDSSKILEEMGIDFAEPFTFHYHDINYDNPMTGKKNMIISGTGYTGEMGVELILPNAYAVELWDILMGFMKKYNGSPCGLGARDTLRMEKGMLLSGHDFNRNRTPYECSISFIMNTDHEFIGKKKVMENKENSSVRFRGFVIEDRGIPREECRIFSEDKEVGEITSGTLSPVLKKGIGLGFIEKKYMKAGTEVDIEIRGKKFRAVLSKPKIVP